MYETPKQEQTTDSEHIPECVEVKLAYDLSVIPLLGLLIYMVLMLIISLKLGIKTAWSAYWLRKSIRRLMVCSVIPLFVVGVIALIMLPSLLECQKAASDNAAQAMLKSIVTAQSTYTTKHKRYAPSLAALVTDGVLQSDGFSTCTAVGVNSQVISGYIFEMTTGRTWTADAFYVRCTPESATAGTYAYSTDTGGKIVSTERY